MRRAPAGGQVLVILAIVMVVLLGFAGVAVDVGRQNAEQRHAQTAADAAALAACSELIEGGTDADAALAAQQVALANLDGSPAGAVATIDSPPTYADQDGSASIEADELVSGIVVAGTSVRVAISSTVETALARVVGIPTLDVVARARCDLQGGPEVPLVVRRYTDPPGPGGGFVDHVATAGTSSLGAVDAIDPRGYAGRIPATELMPGPSFDIYGPGSKAVNDSSFRGFIALDVRNFETVSSRVYYNGVTPGTNPNTLKDMQGEYLVTGYPGPAFPAVGVPPTGDTQVAVLSGNSTSFVVHQFDDSYQAGDRLMLAVYDGTVMEIPDFAIIPPTEIALPSTTVAPVNGPNIRVTRNSQFASTVTLSLKGDAGATTLGFPALDILPDPSVTPPAAGDMSAPTWTPNVFTPTTGGTNVTMTGMRTQTIPAGIYTVWIEGESGNPYYQRRRVAVPVRVQTDANGDGDYTDAGDTRVTRDFSLRNSVLDGSTAALGGTINLPLAVSTGTGTAAWTGGPSAASAVALSWDPDSLTTCSLAPASLASGSIGFSASSVTPATGAGAPSTLSITTTGMSQGCYMFTIRGRGTNSNGQPVTHLETVRFTVAATTSSGQYVDIIGFAVFEIDSIGSNNIQGHAVSGIHASPHDPGLRRAQRARLQPWS
ncbi:MAG TPA: pilus assembly protein TadG-related protein [Candidatus Limnocylindria bacterium]